MLQIPSHLEKQKEVTITKEDMISFETEIKEKYEGGKIPAPIHLSKDNEDELIEIFQYINEDDWVVSAWRNHYHALLHGFDRQELMDSVVEGRSMATSSDVHKFYSSAIVGGIIPIALGLSMALDKEDSNRRVWCFIGDMTFETGVFHEAYKYSRNFNLPLEFIVEDKIAFQEFLVIVAILFPIYLAFLWGKNDRTKS
jgi:TPP-dependent pyruvate/acetoin dehydrogenase alpha subunit